MLKFSQWMEANRTNMYEMYLATAESNSEGQHAFGNQPDRPAKDCTKNVKWKLSYKKLKNYKEIEQMLQGMTVGADEHSFQSYHECQMWLCIRVMIPENIALQINQMEGKEVATPCDNEYALGKFNFTTFERVITDAIRATNSIILPPGVKPPKTKKAGSEGQSRDEYWADVMKRGAASYDKKAQDALYDRLRSMKSPFALNDSPNRGG